MLSISGEAPNMCLPTNLRDAGKIRDGAPKPRGVPGRAPIPKTREERLGSWLDGADGGDSGPVPGDPLPSPRCLFKPAQEDRQHHHPRPPSPRRHVCSGTRNLGKNRSYEKRGEADGGARSPEGTSTGNSSDGGEPTQKPPGGKVEHDQLIAEVAPADLGKTYPIDR